MTKKQEVTVKPDDKGGGIVLINRSDYSTDIRRQLLADNFYKKLQFDPTRSFKSEIDSFLSNACSAALLTKSEKEYLSHDYPTVPVFYILPTVHKSLTNVPGRPTVSGIGSLTELLSNFFDAHIHLLVVNLPSYLKDTNDFLDQLPHVQIPDGQIFLVTLDVSNLYTNIPHSDG